jgi:single-strand DNA-binding protein
MNHVAIIGNIVRDIELKYTPSGAAVAEFSVAVNEVWYNDAKEKQERTHFIGCVAWGKTGENIAKYFSKGQRIAVEGALNQDTWEDKESGKKREKTKVKVLGFDFCGDSKKVAQPEPSSAPVARREAKADPDLDAKEQDDIPF